MGTNNAETFLDKIKCKNKIKNANEFGIDDIKNLKSLLDVSTFKWLKYCKKVQDEMKKEYKKLYKGVCKDLDSLKKNCLAIKKCKPDSLKENAAACLNLKKEIEDMAQKALDEFKEKLKKNNNLDENATVDIKREPVNVKAIKEINELTVEFNNSIKNDKNIGWLYKEVKLTPPKFETYKELESKMRMKRVTNAPLVMVGEFVKDKDRVLEKHKYTINNYLFKYDSNFKSDILKNFYEKLSKLVEVVGLSKDDLKKYFQRIDNFKEINKGVYEDLATGLVKKANEIIDEYNKNKLDDKKVAFATGADEAKLKTKIVEEMGGNVKFVEENVKKESVKKENEGFFSWALNGIKSGVKSVGQYLAEKLWTYSLKDYIKCSNGAVPEDISKNIQALEENFLEAWKEFLSYYTFVSMNLEVSEDIKAIINELYGIFDEYIENIKKAVKKSVSTIGKYNKRPPVNNKNGQVNEQVKPPAKEPVKVEIPKKFDDLLGEFNVSSSKISKTVFKIKRYYDAAVDNAECIIGPLGDFASRYHITPILGTQSVSEMSLGQAILFAEDCIISYKARHFGLSDKLVDYLEENERMKLGITKKELREIIDNS